MLKQSQVLHSLQPVKGLEGPKVRK